MISITFLGTSSAVPTVTRNHSSIFFKYKDENILIDCGEGTQRQLRRAKINPCKITRLLITHLHGDHVFGIPGFFQTLNLNHYQKTLEIYGPKGTKKFIKDMFKTFVLSPIRIKIKINEVKNKVLETPDLKISAVSLEHGIPTLGYIFQEKDKLRIDKKKLESLIKKLKIKKSHEMKKLSQLIKKKDITINKKKLKHKLLTYLQKGKKISIIIDTKLTPAIKKNIKDSDLAIIESTFLNAGDKQKTKEYKHLTAEQATQVAKQAKVKKLILTHFSQRYEFKEKSFLKKAKKIFPNTLLAKDFMNVEV